MRLELSIEDYTIIVNALHYYKKVEKRGNFKQYDVDRVNQLRDHITQQFMQAFNNVERKLT